MGEVHIGAQGWNYDDWIGAFYPRGTRTADSLDLYVKAFNTVEADSTFYAIPSEAAVKSWASRAPDGFTYSLKLPRQITHEQRLCDCAVVLEQFCQRARELGEKLGSVLIQLPPDFSPRSWDALESFMPLLPQDIRFAVEFRDQTWVAEPVVEQLLKLLSKYKVALALVDGKWIDRELSFALIDRPTAPFAYVRWMGLRVLTQFSHVQIDRDRELSQWAKAFATLRQQVEVIYGYFNNHYQGHSPASANQFKRLVGQSVIEPESLIVQPSLF
ncbi:MAG: DUF72 domain-containing protein [Blastocatellia bacterium]